MSNHQLDVVKSSVGTTLQEGNQDSQQSWLTDIASCLSHTELVTHHLLVLESQRSASAMNSMHTSINLLFWLGLL
jgi:hypothetical protein